MSKQYFNLYPRIHHPLNLWAAYCQAARGKRSQPAVAAFEFDLEANLLALESELQQGRYQPGPYHNFTITTPKRRIISAAPFRDRVVHHALMNVISPLFERQFIYNSYANRQGKGTHRALDRCTHYLRRYRYVLPLDVVQFFPAIDHQLLFGILARTIGDPQVLGLVSKLIASGAGVQAGEYQMTFFPGNHCAEEQRLCALQQPRGLPIGNLTSQHWANVYLNELDQYAKRVLKCRAYLRYVDDVLIFADDKAALNEWRQAIVAFLHGLRLAIHTNSAQPRPSGTGLPFLGFIVYPDHRRLKPRTGLAFRRRLKSLARRWRAGELETIHLHANLQGWLNHASHGDTWGLRRAVLASAGLAWE